MQEGIPSEQPTESRERDKEESVMLDYYEVFFARVLHLYGERSDDDKRTFAEFLEGYHYAVENFHRLLQEKGIKKTEEQLNGEINEAVATRGARGVAEYVMGYAQLVRAGEDEGEREKKLLHIEPVEGPLPQMEGTGFDPEGKFLRMHVSSLHTLNRTDLLSVLRRELHEIAKSIVNNYPDSQAIVGMSWLLDSPVAHRIGFTVLEGVETDEDTIALRGQLISSDGTINRERSQMYIETGKLPYKMRFGYIPTNEFLSRYLNTEDEEEGTAR